MAKTDSIGIVVCDAGPLIHLDELGALDLLSDFPEVRVSNAVWKEVARHRPSALRRRAIQLRRVTELPEASPGLNHLAEALSLSAGEVQALRLMQEVPDGVFLTDDAAARLVAQRLEFEVHGTIGMIVRALRQRQRTKRQVVNLLRAIPRRSTLFIDRRLLDSVIDEVNMT